jgi:hypothetical protein
MKELRFSITLSVAAALSLACGTEDPPAYAPTIGAIELSSDFVPLVEGFDWAKRQSLAYAYEGDPVGKWYEAALPGREAFCMRDASHQATGALALGLWEHTKNMNTRFALGIAESRDWCSYWEINRHDKPAPVDYRSDDDFWYNLPANFDVVQTCYRAFEWTGDADYLNDPVFDEFYRRSLTDYIATWDVNGDGLMESSEENGIRGIPSYWEGGGPRALTGGDLVAAQYAANLAYSRMLEQRGRVEDADRFARVAGQLKRLYNETWWNPELGRFYSLIIQDGSFDTTRIPAMQIFPLYFRIVEPDRADRLFQNLETGTNVEENSYLAETHYLHGRDDAAFRYLMAQMDPALARREYPENPFTAVGGIVRYLVGVKPVASQAMIETRPRLPAEVGWVRLDHVPALANQINVHHVGLGETRLENDSGPALRWRAVFPGEHHWLMVDGTRFEAMLQLTEYGTAESFVVLDVAPGQGRTVRVE